MLPEHQWKSLSHVQLFETPWTIGWKLLCPWNCLGQNTGVGSHSLLQGIIPTQGLNPGLSPVLGRFFTIQASKEVPQKTNNCSKPLPTSQNDKKPVGLSHSPRSYCDCPSTETSKSFGKRKEKRFVGEGGEMWRARSSDSAEKDKDGEHSQTAMAEFGKAQGRCWWNNWDEWPLST